MPSDKTPDNQDLVRLKPTSIESVLPKASELVERQKNKKLRFIDLEGSEQFIDYQEICRRDDLPIPLPVDREGYCSLENSGQFWATGYGDWLNVKEAIDRFGSSNYQRLLDFGCATGRFLRHVHFFSDLEPHGCDYAPANIEWMKRHLGEKFKVKPNTAKPSLEYHSGYFDVVTALSVFTHIDIDELNWLKELARITNRNGLLYISVQNQDSWSKVLERPSRLQHLLRANAIEGNLKVEESIFADKLPKQRIVFRMTQEEIYNANVWVTDDYIHQTWSQHIEILGIFKNAHSSFQSVVVARPLK